MKDKGLIRFVLGRVRAAFLTWVGIEMFDPESAITREESEGSWYIIISTRQNGIYGIIDKSEKVKELLKEYEYNETIKLSNIFVTPSDNSKYTLTIWFKFKIGED